MVYNPNIHKRKSIRLEGFDYSSNGVYFVNICTQNGKEWFGSVGAGQRPALILNDYGKIVEQGWINISQIYGNVEIDEFVVMPNHLHGIIKIDNYKNIDQVRASQCLAPTDMHVNKRKTVGSVIGQFKSTMTKILRREGLWEFEWQRNYYEHIIRSEIQLKETRLYIKNNPVNLDKDNEDAFSIGGFYGDK